MLSLVDEFVDKKIEEKNNSEKKTEIPKNLTSSSINRLNVISNKFAIAEIKNSFGIKFFSI